MAYPYYSKRNSYYARRKARVVARPQRTRRAPVYKRRSYRKSSKYDYPGVGKAIGSGIGSMAGNLIAPGAGGALGSALGSVVGGGAQSLIKKITGFGDYNVSKNSLMYNVDAIPEFSVNNERCTMVCHREYISDVRATVSFSTQTYRINPGVATTFPWLSSIAQNYEQYVVQGMIFEYKTTSATAIASTNTGLGTVVLATQYNSLSQPFTNKQQMEAYEFSQSTVPSQSVIHPIECDPQQTQAGGIYNVWDPSNPTAGDRRLYDVGTLTVATTGMPADNAVIGELWVSYKICLLKPKLSAVVGLADVYQLDVSSINSANPLGNTNLAVPSSYNDNFTTLSNNARITFNNAFVGLVQIILTYRLTTSSNITMPYMTAFSGCTNVTADYTGISNTTQPLYNASVANYMVGFIRKSYSVVNGLSGYVNLNGATIAGTIDSAYLTIISVPDNIYNDPFP